MTHFDLASRYQRLDDIAQLKKGWLDGEGEDINSDVVNIVRELLPAFYSTFKPNTGIQVYPTAQGGVMLEWEDTKGRHIIEVI